SVQQFSSRVTGGSLRLGFPLMENLWLTNSYTLTNSEISDVQSTASEAIKEAAGSYWTSALGSSLTYDQRNNPKTPTSGYFFQIGTEFAGLGGDVQYIRNSAEARFYYPLTEKITLVGRAIGGRLDGWGGHGVRLPHPHFKGGGTNPGLYPSRLCPPRPFSP